MSLFLTHARFTVLICTVKCTLNTTKDPHSLPIHFKYRKESYLQRILQMVLGWLTHVSLSCTNMALKSHPDLCQQREDSEPVSIHNNACEWKHCCFVFRCQRKAFKWSDVESQWQGLSARTSANRERTVTNRLSAFTTTLVKEDFVRRRCSSLSAEGLSMTGRCAFERWWSAVQLEPGD